MIISFIVAFMAGVLSVIIGHYVIKWLESRSKGN